MGCERARSYGILTIKMRQKRGIVRRKFPGSGRGPHVIGVTGEVDLWKEPLDFEDSFRTHMANGRSRKIVRQIERLFASDLSRISNCPRQLNYPR